MKCNVNIQTAAVKDICYKAGSEISNNCTFAITDENDAAVDLSGVEMELQVKFKPEDPHTKVIIEFLTSDGTITVGGVGNNEITLHGTYQVDNGNLYYDLLRKDIPEYVQEGVFKVYGNVTR